MLDVFNVQKMTRSTTKAFLFLFDVFHVQNITRLTTKYFCFVWCFPRSKHWHVNYEDSSVLFHVFHVQKMDRSTTKVFLYCLIFSIFKIWPGQLQRFNLFVWYFPYSKDGQINYEGISVLFDIFHIQKMDRSTSKVFLFCWMFSIFKRWTGQLRRYFCFVW